MRILLRISMREAPRVQALARLWARPRRRHGGQRAPNVATRGSKDSRGWTVLTGFPRRGGARCSNTLEASYIAVLLVGCNSTIAARLTGIDPCARRSLTFEIFGNYPRGRFRCQSVSTASGGFR